MRKLISARRSGNGAECGDALGEKSQAKIKERVERVYFNDIKLLSLIM